MIKIKRIGILTSKESWFIPHAKLLRDIFSWIGYDSSIFFKHENIREEVDVLFILSYFNFVPEEVLEKNSYNLVVHESDLPKGKGWSPLFWQILEGKNKIPIVLFEAESKVDSGKIYLKDYITLNGDELHDEIREKQASKTMELCLKFIVNCKNISPVNQKGKPTFFPKRTPENSELDVNKSIEEQFNLLRVVSNTQYPAYFTINNTKYLLYIFKEVNNEK